MVSKRCLRAVSLIAATACVFSVSACGESSQGSSDGGKTTVTVWAWEPLVKKAVAGFEKEHPDITVKVNNVGSNPDEYTQFSNALQAGNGLPDLIQLGVEVIPQYALSGALEDVTQFGAADVIKQQTPAARNAVKMQGGIYGLVQGDGPMALFYNKEIFDKAGVTEPPKTWDEYYEAAKKIHALGSDYYITSDSGDAGTALAMIQAAGGHPFKVDGENVTIDLKTDSGVKAYAEWWQKMVDEGLIDTKTAGWSDEWFRTLNDGHTASLLTAAWMPITLQTNAPDAAGKWRVAALPTPNGEPVSSANGSGALSVVKDSPNAKAAYEFAKYIAVGKGQDMYVENGSYPAKVSIMNDASFKEKEYPYFGGQKINEVFNKSASRVTEFQYLPFQLYANSVFKDYIGNALDGSSTFAKEFASWQTKITEYGEDQGYTVK